MAKNTKMIIFLKLESETKTHQLNLCKLKAEIEKLVLLKRKNKIKTVSSVAQLCLTLCDPMNRNMPGIPVHHQLPEFTQSHVH